MVIKYDLPFKSQAGHCFPPQSEWLKLYRDGSGRGNLGRLVYEELCRTVKVNLFVFFGPLGAGGSNLAEILTIFFWLKKF